MELVAKHDLILQQQKKHLKFSQTQTVFVSILHTTVTDFAILNIDFWISIFTRLSNSEPLALFIDVKLTLM